MCGEGAAKSEKRVFEKSVEDEILCDTLSKKKRNSSFVAGRR